MHPALIDPWQAALDMEGNTVLAILTATSGSAYRKAGAAMAIASDDSWAGAITSGCVEADIVLQAREVRATGRPKRLCYGENSPYFDIRLPCGGSIEVTLFLLRDRPVLERLAERRKQRIPVCLHVFPHGKLVLCGGGHADSEVGGLVIHFAPPTRLVILGAGSEALVFAQMAASLGRDHILLSHDETTLRSTGSLGITNRALTRLGDLRSVPIDAHTAVTLFYHDHDREPQILQYVLASEAFYIGAQGSARAHLTRLAQLEALGIVEQERGRVHGPIGLIRSTRDPQALAISVLAEITEAETRRSGRLLTQQVRTD